MSTTQNGLKTHMVFNAEDILKDPTGNPLRSQEGGTFPNPKSRHFNAQTGRAYVPGSIIIQQRVDNANEAGHLPDLLTANTVKLLASKYERLLFIDGKDYPSHSTLGPKTKETSSGVEVIEYRYKIPTVPEEVDFPEE